MAQGLCRMLVQTRNFKFDNIELEENLTILSKEKEELHKDSLTGVYSGKGLEAILRQLYQPENITRLISDNYHVRIICADVNDLKKHNAGPGGHHQGDIAIKTVGRALVNFVESGRRINQTFNAAGEIITNRQDRRTNTDIPTRFVARSNDRGDEFLAISIVNKYGVKSIRGIRENLEKILSDLHYEYDNQLYKVSATYGAVTIKMPRTLPAFHHVIKQIDSEMMKHKQKIKSAEHKIDRSALRALGIDQPMGVVLDKINNIDID